MPIRVLFFIDRLRLGGIQALVRDIIDHLDSSKMTIDILNLDDGIDYPLHKELETKGVTIYKLKGVWMRTPLDFPKYFKSVDRFFAEHHDYDVVHMHSSSKNYYILECAAKYDIPVRVSHSHNTGFQTHNPFSVFLGDMMKKPLMRWSNVWLGCSELACEWLYGKDCVKNGYAKVLLNGIDSKSFVYNESIRKEVRKDLGIEERFVIGHVGRFEKQKNHTFLIDTFAEIAKQRADAVLILIGIGSLKEEIEAKVRDLGLQDKVIFLGFRDDRNRVMQAMDSFIFPSIHEGLSVVLLEAQASGMPVFVSDSTTTEVTYSPHIQFLSLSDGPSSWAQAVLNKGAVERVDMTEKIIESKFEIRTMIELLEDIYREKLG